MSVAIDELVLEGLDGADAETLRRQVEVELARLVPGEAAAPLSGREVDAVDAGEAEPSQAGAAIARAVHRELAP